MDCPPGRYGKGGAERGRRAAGRRAALRNRAHARLRAAVVEMFTRSAPGRRSCGGDL